MNRKYYMRDTFLVTLLTVVAACSEPSVNNAGAEQKSISVTQSDFLQTFLPELERTVPQSFCSPDEFAATCFTVPAEQCKADMKPLFQTCASQLKSTINMDEIAFTCDSREDCAEKGSELGRSYGQRVGACIGTNYERKHSAAFQKEACFSFLRSRGVDTQALELQYQNTK